MLFDWVPRSAITLSRRRVLQRAAGGGLVIVATALAREINAAPYRQASPSTFVLATERAPSDLDPHSAYDAGSGVAVQGPYEGLIRLKPGTVDEYLPLLAESWMPNADKSVWTFRLRDGVTFHDGTPCDAEAARASFARLLSLGSAPAQVLGRFITELTQITAPDTRTLVFDLGTPQPLFEAALASSYGTAIINVAAVRAHEVEGDQGHAWAQSNADGLGTGPYRIVSFDVADGVVLERYDGYWGGWDDDHFTRIIIRVVAEAETRRALLEAGDADLVTSLPLASVPELEQNVDLVVDRRYNLAVRYLAMTVAGPLQSPTARQALCWAFPYEEVLSGVYMGMAKRAIGPVAELCRGFESATFVYETDLDRARALFDQSGVGAGTVLTILVPTGSPQTLSIAELFQSNLAAIGRELQIQTTDFASYIGVAFGELPAEERPHLFPWFWQPDYNDGWNHLWPQVSCDAWQAGNIGHYCNRRVEALLEQARAAGDAATYQAALSDIQQILTRVDPAAIYTAQTQWLTVLRRDIGGFTPNLVVGEIIDFYALHREANNR